MLPASSFRTITRVTALWLVLLAALPWTAPFATLDVGPPTSLTPSLDSAKAKHAHHDAIPGVAGAVVPLTLAFTLVFRSTASVVREVGGAQHAVLRI